MVNSETDKDQKRVRNVVGAYPHDKDDAKEQAALIVDMETKYKAFKESVLKAIPEVKGEIEKKIDKAKEDALRKEQEKKEAEEAKAKEIAELEAKLAELNAKP